jgi:hypothetical protein
MRLVRLAILGSCLALTAGAPAASARDAVDVGPGPVSATLMHGPHRLVLRISPNRATSANAIQLTVTRAGKPLRHARVTLSFTMAAMGMGPQAFPLTELRPGVYSFTGRAMVMGGSWGLALSVTPRGGTRYSFALVDDLRP